MNALNLNDINYIRELVRRHSAIVLEPDKAYLIETRLAPLAQQTGFASLQELIAALRSNTVQGLLGRVMEAITTHETSFFRDLHPLSLIHI